MIAAAQNLGTVVFPVVATKMSTSTTKVTASQLEWANGGVYQIGNPNVGLTMAQAAALFTSPPKGFGSYTFPTNIAYRVGGSKFFEVSVDIETGQVQVQRFFTGMDIGKSPVLQRCDESGKRRPVYRGWRSTYSREVE